MDDHLFLVTLYGPDGRRIGLEIDPDAVNVAARGQIAARAHGPGTTVKLWECKEIRIPKAEKE